MKLSVSSSSFTLCLLMTTTLSLCCLIGADEFEEITEKYCEAESLADERMVKVEQCYKLAPIDFLGLNPFSDCKKQLFTHGETDSQIRTALCSDDALDEKFEDCMEAAILEHDGFKLMFQQRLECIRTALA